MTSDQATLVLPEATASQFADGRIAWSFVRNAIACVSKGTLIGHIDLSRVRHIKPYAIAILVAVVHRLRAPNLSVTWPVDSDARDHLARLRLPDALGIADGPAVSERPTNLPIESVSGPPPAEFSYNAAKLLQDELGVDLPANVFPHIEDSIWEIVMNAASHSRSDVGCVVAGQAFPRAGNLEVAIVDLGVTILGHLSQRFPSLISDAQAIREAMKEGVTGTVERNLLGEVNSGYGLFGVQQAVGALGGELAILSGSAIVCSGKIDVEHQLYGPPFGGTLVNIRFNTDFS